MSDEKKLDLRWSCLGGHFFCQISKQILFKTEDGGTHPLALNRSVLGGARKVGFLVILFFEFHGR